jgi:predicted enzyme related to lactoylglutathione lyase
MSDTVIKGVTFISVYVDDFEAGYKFYSEVLGLEKEYDMGKLACFFKLGADSGLYLQGGNKKITIDDKTMRTAFTLNIPSAHAMFEKLKAAGVKFVQNAPMDMGQGSFWFQFYDPAGNILEVLGGK